MANALTSLLAKRYLLSRRGGGFASLVAWFSMLGIMLGVATLILVTSLMNGIQKEMLANFIGVDGHIEIYSTSGTIPDFEALTDTLTRHVPAGTTIVPRVKGQVMVSGAGGAARGAQVIGLRPDDLQHKALLRDALTDTATARFTANEGIISGARLAEGLRVEEGGKLTLISPQGRATAFGSVPRIKAYPLAGTFSLGMHALDNSLILMPYDKALIYFAMKRKGAHPASSLELTLPNMEHAESVAAILQRTLGQEYRVYPWQQSHKSVFTALEVQRNVMVIILALIVLVAAFNIISSLVMLVKDKQSDIAILRTMGMSRSTILGLFVAVGMSIGALGTFFGTILGVLAAQYIETLKAFIETITGQEIMVDQLYFLSGLPTKTDPMEVIMVVIAALLIALLATLYPAYKAASTEPAEALRYG